MPLTQQQHEKVSAIPEAYKTFLLTLWDVVRTQEDGSMIRVSGIPFYMIANRVHEQHGLGESEIQQMARTLISRGWIDADNFGFYVPKGQGIDVLRAIMGQQHAETAPELPEI